MLPIALAVSSAFLIETLDGTILVSAIPAIAREFGVAPLRLNLAVSVYLVVIAAVVPASAWLADRFGARRLFLWAIGGFLLASLAAALAHDLPTLIATRVLQGIAGGLMTPVGRLLLIRSVPRSELANAIAWMSMPVLIGPVLGPLIGGVLVTYASWRWIFVVGVPIGLVGLVVAARLLPADEAPERRPFDLIGFLLCAVALSALQIALEGVVHPVLPPGLSVLPWLVAALLFAAYLRHAQRRMRPVLELNLLRFRLFRVALLAGGLSRIGLNAAPFLLQLQLQLGFGWSAARAGSVVFAVAAGALVLKPLMRHLLALLGFRRTLGLNGLAGAVLAGAMGLLTPSTPLWAILAIVLFYGVARSLQFNTINALLYAEMPRDRQSASTALGGVGQQLSMGLGISLAAAAVAQLSRLGLAPQSTAIAAAMLALAATTGISALLFLACLRPDDGEEVARRRPKTAGAAA